MPFLFISLIKGLLIFVLFFKESTFFFFFFFSSRAGWLGGILVPWSGIEPGPLAVRGPSRNHWTAREFRKESTFSFLSAVYWIFVLFFLDFFPFIISFLLPSLGSSCSFPNFWKLKLNSLIFSLSFLMYAFKAINFLLSTVFFVCVFCFCFYYLFFYLGCARS